ncbi:MAG: hypothetical protein K2O86_00210 [Clostridia bacterium]|nr:hypothetical protein [Clostridia bacterium]
MKRKSVKVFLVLCVVLIVALFATACKNTPSQLSNEYLKTRDFSFDNVSEVIMRYYPSYPPIQVYSIKKGESQEVDEVLSQVLEAWTTFQKDACFNDDIKGKAMDGGSITYECVFVDGSKITIRKDYLQNYVLNDFDSCQLVDEDMYEDFSDKIFTLLKQDKYLEEE